MFKNIIYIHGNNSSGVEEEIRRWIGAFVSKFWDVNIERIRIEDVKDPYELTGNLLSGGLFAEKRLFVFSWGRERKSKTEWLESLLKSRADAIPEDHFCLFHNIRETESGLIEWLQKNADNRSIDTLWDTDIWARRFGDVDTQDIKKILEWYKKIEFSKEKWATSPLLGHKIAQSLMMKSLGNNSSEILFFEQGWGKIFDLIDMILEWKSTWALALTRKLAETISSAELLNSLISLLRNYLYISVLKDRGYREPDIASTIKVHPFILKKGMSISIGTEKLKNFMQKLYHANRAYKSGRWIKDAELWRIFEIELAIMGLKK